MARRRKSRPLRRRKRSPLFRQEPNPNRWSANVALVSNLSALQKKLGYAFQDEGFLRLALTHPSVAHETPGNTPHNQRLEFLGDAVLGLVLTGELYQKFPSFGEGPLTKARAQMVNRRTLAAEARL